MLTQKQLQLDNYIHKVFVCFFFSFQQQQPVRGDLVILYPYTTLRTVITEYTTKAGIPRVFKNSLTSLRNLPVDN